MKEISVMLYKHRYVSSSSSFVLFFLKAVVIQGKILIFVYFFLKKQTFLWDYFFGSHFSFCFHSNHIWLICVVAMVTPVLFLPLL